jgi:hypothetical protein
MREDLALAIENFIVELFGAIVALPKKIGLAFAEVGGLMVQSFDGVPGGQSAFQNEISSLVSPHLAVLAHKRSKMYVPGDEAAMERWALELCCFMDRNMLPLMGTDRDYAERNRIFVASLVDREVVREQVKVRQASNEDYLPRVTRYESSWVG